MRNKLLKAISPIFFWLSMITFIVMSTFLIFVNYKIIIINSVIAAEPVYKVIESTPQSDVVSKIDPVSCDCEKKFEKEDSITWSGKIIASFLSGEDFGVENFDKSSKYQKFYVIGQNKYMGVNGVNVKVVGQLVGITCAYANTVFGECVGEVIADEVFELDN